MNCYCLLLLLFCQVLASAQSTRKDHQVRLVAGRSVHGTGDMRGLAFSTEYAQAFRPRLSWTLAVGGSIHDTRMPVYFTGLNGEERDGSIRNTTAGAQLAALFGFSPVRAVRHEVLLEGGPLFRYQSTSYADITAIYSPMATGLPVPVIQFVHSSPQRTYSVGGMVRLLYQFSVSRQVRLGAAAGFQTDTNGDMLTQTALGISRSF